MWQLYAASKDAFFLEEARRAEVLLTDELRRFTKLNHDVGFVALPALTGADYRRPGGSSPGWTACTPPAC